MIQTQLCFHFKYTCISNHFFAFQNDFNHSSSLVWVHKIHIKIALKLIQDLKLFHLTNSINFTHCIWLSLPTRLHSVSAGTKFYYLPASPSSILHNYRFLERSRTQSPVSSIVINRYPMGIKITPACTIWNLDVRSIGLRLNPMVSSLDTQLTIIKHTFFIFSTYLYQFFRLKMASINDINRNFTLLEIDEKMVDTLS